MDDYKIHEVEVHLTSGIKLKVEATTLAGVKKLLDDLSKQNLSVRPLDDPEENKGGSQAAAKDDNEHPINRIELDAGLSANALVPLKVVAFKDGVPQLLRPSAFQNVTDAVLFLLYCVETGLKKSRIDYDSFKGLFESQNIKSGSPLSMLINNLKNAGYINKPAYENERNLALSGKGQIKAREVLKAIRS